MNKKLIKALNFVYQYKLSNVEIQIVTQLLKKPLTSLEISTKINNSENNLRRPLLLLGLKKLVNKSAKSSGRKRYLYMIDHSLLPVLA